MYIATIIQTKLIKIIKYINYYFNNLNQFSRNLFRKNSSAIILSISRTDQRIDTKKNETLTSVEFERLQKCYRLPAKPRESEKEKEKRKIQQLNRNCLEARE